jgi:effector-binding domain-containing protein
MLRAMTVDVNVKTVEPTFTGRVAKIGDTHHAVCEWSKANGYRLVGPRWEIYGDPDPSTGDFDVDVFWSLEAL